MKHLLLGLLAFTLFSCAKDQTSWQDQIEEEWCKCWYEETACYVDDIYYSQDSILLLNHVVIDEEGNYSLVENIVVAREEVTLDPC